MTYQEVIREVERIKTLTGDPEVAHSAEDNLWRSVLKTMSHWDGCEIAEAALLTTTIEFPRWYA